MVCPLYRECPLLRDFKLHYIDRGLKFGDLVLSIVERYLIQCPLFGVSIKRDSTLHITASQNVKIPGQMDLIPGQMVNSWTILPWMVGRYAIAHKNLNKMRGKN